MSTFQEFGLLDLLRCVSWVVVILLIGVAAWRLLDRRSHPTVPWSLSFAYGAGVCMTAASVSAALRIDARVPLALLGIVSAAIAGIELRRGRIHWIPPWAVGSLEAFSRRRGSLLFAALLFVGWALALPLLTKPHLAYDILSYHLPMAHRLAGGNGLAYDPSNFYSRLPLGAFALYGPFLSDRGSTLDDPGTRVLLWAAFVACSLLCGRLAGHLGARRPAQLLAAGLFAWHPLVWSSLLNAHSDVLTALFGLAAFDCLLAGTATGRVRPFVASGFLAGCAAAVKLSAVGVVLLPAILLTALPCLPPRRLKVATAIARAAVLVGGFLLAFGLWSVRSSVLAGHPMHPFGGRTADWSAEQTEFLLSRHHPAGPLQIGYWSDAVTKTDAFGYSIPPGGAGLSVLLLVGVAGAFLPRLGSARWALAGVLAGYASWLTVGLNPARFLLPSAGLLIAVCARSASAFPRPSWRIGAIVVLAAAAILSIKPVERLLIVTDPEVWTTGPIPAEILAQTHAEAEEGRVLLLFEARGRLFPPNYQDTTVWDRPPWAGDLKAALDAEDFANRLAARGFTHLFVNEAEFGRLIDFYGNLDGPRLWGQVGMRSGREEVVALLEAYPSFQFAGFDTRENGVLYEFLLASRLNAVRVSPAGPVSELWLAPIQPTPTPLDP